MKRLLSVILMLVMVIGIFGVQTAFAGGHTEEEDLGILPYSYISMYPGETVDDYGLNGLGNGKKMQVWNDFLFVPVHYDKITGTDPNRNILFVYDLTYGAPTLYAKWNMEDLGMKIRSTEDTAAPEDAITGVYVDDDNIYISVIATETVAAGYKRMQGVYIYENSLDRNAEAVTAPTRLTDATVRDSAAGWIRTCNQPVIYSIAFMRGVTMQKVGDYLVTVHDKHTVTDAVKSAHIGVTDVSDPMTATDADVTVVNEGNLLVYTGAGGVETIPTFVLDAKFEGSFGYILCGNSTYKEYILFRVDFTVPTAPSVTNYLVLDATDYYTETAFLAIEGNYGYVSNTVAQGKTDMNVLYTIDMTDRADMALIAAIPVRENLFMISNESEYDAKSAGLGPVAVYGNIVVGIETGSAYNYTHKLVLSEDRTEVYDGVATFIQSNEAMASAASSLVYGNTAYFTSVDTKFTNTAAAKASILSMFDFTQLTPYSVSVDNFGGAQAAPFTLSGSIYGLPNVIIEIDDGSSVETYNVEATWSDEGGQYGKWALEIPEMGEYDIKVYAADGDYAYPNTLVRTNLYTDRMLVREVSVSALATGKYAEGTLPVDVTVSNTEANTVTGVPIVAAYKGKELVAVEVADSISVNSMEDVKTSVRLTIPAEPVDGYSDYVIKTFFWKSTDSIMPAAGNHTQYAINPISSGDELGALNWTIVRNTQLKEGVTDTTEEYNKYANGATRQMSVYNDLLVVPVAYSGIETADKNKLVIYDLASSEIDYKETKTTLVDGTTTKIYPDANPEKVAEWNMEDLGMKLRSTTQDSVAGAYITDEYIFIPVVKSEDDGTKTVGLYIYNNNLNDENITAPTLAIGEDITGTDDGFITLYNNAHATLLYPSSNAGMTMEYINGKLVIIPAGTQLHRTKGAKIAVVDLSDMSNITTTAYAGYDIIKKADGSALGVTGLKDNAMIGGVKFVGNKAYMSVTDKNESNTKYLAVVDFSDPANPVWERSVVLGAGVDTVADSSNLTIDNGYAYVTTGGDKLFEGSYLYIVKLSDMSVNSISLIEEGFGPANSGGFGITAVKGDVLLSFDGGPRIFADYRMELNPAKNGLLYTYQRINSIHSNGLISQANGYVIYGQKIFVSMNTPTSYQRLGLCDMYHCAPFAVFDLSTVHINY